MALIQTKAKLFNKQQYELAVLKAKEPKFVEKYVLPFRADLELLNSKCPIFILTTEESKGYVSQKSLMEPHVKKWEAHVRDYLRNPTKLRESEYYILGESKDFHYRGFLTPNNELRYLWHSLPMEFVVSLRSLIDYHFETMVVERRTANISNMNTHRSFSGKSLKTKFLESNPKDLFSLQEVYPEPLPSLVLFPGENLSYLDLNPEFGNNSIIADLLNLNYTTKEFSGEYDRVIFHPRHCNILFTDTDVVISPVEFIRKTIERCYLGWQHLKKDGIFSLEMESLQINGNGFEITTKIIETMNLLTDATFLGCSAYSTAKNMHPVAHGVWSWQKSSLDSGSNVVEAIDDCISMPKLGGIRSLIPNFSLLSSPVNIIGISGFDSCCVALAMFGRQQQKTVTLISLIETQFTVMARRLGACVKVFHDFSESDLKSYLNSHKQNFSTSVHPFQLASRSHLFSFPLPIVPTRLWLIYATGFTYTLIRANYPNLPICVVDVHLINLPTINDPNLVIYSSPYPIEEQSLEFKLREIYLAHKQPGDMYLL